MGRAPHTNTGTQLRFLNEIIIGHFIGYSFNTFWRLKGHSFDGKCTTNGTQIKLSFDVHGKLIGQANEKWNTHSMEQAYQKDSNDPILPRSKKTHITHWKLMWNSFYGTQMRYLFIVYEKLMELSQNTLDKCYSQLSDFFTGQFIYLMESL